MRRRRGERKQTESGKERWGREEGEKKKNEKKGGKENLKVLQDTPLEIETPLDPGVHIVVSITAV